jgi:hypothetical protein
MATPVAISAAAIAPKPHPGVAATSFSVVLPQPIRPTTTLEQLSRMGSAPGQRALVRRGRTVPRGGTMTSDHGGPGSIPRHQRRLMIVSCAIIFVVICAGCLLVNVFAGSPVDWFWLVAGALFVTGLMAAWFWVRLSN